MSHLFRGGVRAPFSLALIALLSSTAVPALAQDMAADEAQATDEVPADDTATTDSDYDGVVIVIGQREAERRAVARKRDANTIQDSVAANDVGKLPDQNVAEAVRRIPGISVANDQGEGRYVVIRGTDPNLANVTVNGQTAPAPEPEGRQVKLDDIPSSLIGSVDVIKALTADRDANAIAGQVDINTLTAFDRSGTFIQARGAVGIYDLNGKHPWEADGTVGTRLGEDFGVVVSGNYSRRPIKSENLQGSSNWRVVNGQVVPDDFRLRDYNLTRTRYGGVANFDYRPSDDFQLYARFLYSVYKDNETRDQARIEIPTTITGQTATSGTFNGRGTIFVRRRIENDQTYTGELGGKFGIAGGTLELSGTYSKAFKKDPLRSEFSFRSGSSTIAGNVYDLTDTLFIVNRGVRAFDPTAFPGYRVNYDQRRAAEELFQARADYTLPVGSGDSTIKAGAKFISRDRSNNRDYQQYNLASATNLGTSGSAITAPLYIYDGRYAFGPRIDYDLAQTYYTVTNPAARTLDTAASLGNSLVNDYTFNEKIYAGYAMATLVLGDLTVIPGVRVEHTEGDVAGKSVTATSTLTQGFNIFDDYSYTDAFPSLNLRYDAGDLTVRAAVTTAIGRPNFAQLAPYTQVDAGANTVNLGNPDLKPLKAWNGDLSIEYYLPNKGVISIAGFYKNLDDPITVGGYTATGTFGGVALTNAQITSPLNGDKAEIYGVEVNAQVPFTFLPAPFDGLGIAANYTRTGGKTEGLPIPGRTQSADNYLQSRDVASVQAYFEKDRIALRVAWSYRSHYLDTVGATRALDQYTADHEQWDARGSFAFSKEVLFFVEGSNLSDSPWRRWIGNDRQLVENERYGYSARAGIQLAF